MVSHSAKFVVVLASALVACGVASPPASVGSATPSTAASPTPLTRVRIGAFQASGSAITYVVQSLGFYKNQGLDVEIVPFTDVPTANAALFGGEIQVLATATERPATVADAAGPQLRAISGLYLHALQVFVARKDLPVRSSDPVSKWKGLTLGDAGAQTPQRFIGNAILKEAGLDPEKDVKHLVVPAGTASIATFEQGAVDILVTQEPTVSAIIGRGTGKILLDLRTTNSRFASIPVTALVAREDYIGKNADAMHRLAKATCAGLKSAVADPQKAADEIIKFYQQNNPNIDANSVRQSLINDAPAWGAKLEQSKVDSWLALLFENGGLKKAYKYGDIVSRDFEPDWTC